MRHVFNQCADGRALMRSFLLCSQLQNLKAAFLDGLVHMKVLCQDLG
jgi:hypothetical protein